ncbi:MAG: hypothetical protein U0790_23525 [Isosphaeraceae bacterium]
MQNGLTTAGLLATLLGIVIAGVICHYLFYLVPWPFGQKTGLPLYAVVGTSTARSAACSCRAS